MNPGQSHGALLVTLCNQWCFRGGKKNCSKVKIEQISLRSCWGWAKVWEVHKRTSVTFRGQRKMAAFKFMPRSHEFNFSEDSFVHSAEYSYCVWPIIWTSFLFPERGSSAKQNNKTDRNCSLCRQCSQQSCSTYALCTFRAGLGSEGVNIPYSYNDNRSNNNRNYGGHQRSFSAPNSRSKCTHFQQRPEGPKQSAHQHACPLQWCILNKFLSGIKEITCHRETRQTDKKLSRS